MEHRIGSRIPANLEAEIYQGDKRLGAFPVRNIGDNGLCVENSGNRLQPDNFLQIVITSSCQAGQSRCITYALVVWASGHYAGLLRADHNAEFLQLFKEATKDSQKVAQDANKDSDAGASPTPDIQSCIKSRQIWTADNAANQVTALNVFCSQCCTRRRCLLGCLDAEQLSGLWGMVRHPKPMHKGDRLFIQGDDFSSLYLVRSGSFKSSILDDTGDRQITGFHFTGDVLGADGIATGRHLYEVETLETASVCTLSFAIFTQASGHKQGALYRRLVAAVSSMAFRDSHLLMVLGRMHAEQRLASFLLDISKRMGERGESAHEFNLSMARYDIANYLGLAIETVSRLFRRFQEEELIQADRHRVCILDMTGLQELVASEHRFSGVRNIA